MRDTVIKGKQEMGKHSQPLGGSPLTLTLTEDGKTLVAFYGNCRAVAIARLLAIMGDPEFICPGEYNPDVVWILWPHQEMNEGLRIAAESMTTDNLLSSLGYYDNSGQMLDTQH